MNIIVRFDWPFRPVIFFPQKLWSYIGDEKIFFFNIRIPIKLFDRVLKLNNSFTSFHLWPSCIEFNSFLTLKITSEGGTVKIIS